MHPLLLSTTEDGTGKTAVALALGKLAIERDLEVRYMKPKGTRLESHLGQTVDRDPSFAAEYLGLEGDAGALSPIVYSSTFITGVLRGQERPETLRQAVTDRYESVSDDADFTILEGGGHIDTGAVIDLDDPALAEMLDCSVVLIATYHQAEDIDPVLAAVRRFGDRLSGVIFNAVGDAEFDELDADVVPYLESADIPVHGVIPRRRELAGVTVEHLASELGAEVLIDAGMDNFVERLLIGAMGGKAAASHLRRTRGAVVITGGDRADIQSVAIEAPGVQCILLTGGQHPTEAILGRAAAENVPILSVPSDTATAVDRVEQVVRSGRARDHETVDLMAELLLDYAEVDALLPST